MILDPQSARDMLALQRMGARALLAAEKRAKASLVPTLAAAQSRVLAEVLRSGGDMRSLRVAVAHAGNAAASDVRQAVLALRRDAREEGRQQERREAAYAAARMVLDGMAPPRALFVSSELGNDEHEDESRADAAGDALSAQTKTILLAILLLWHRRGEDVQRLGQRLTRSLVVLRQRAERTAITESAQAWNSEHKRAEAEVVRGVMGGGYRDLAPGGPARVELPPVGPGDILVGGVRPAPAPPTPGAPLHEPPEDYPSGRWEAGMIRVWSALLDRKTCPDCWRRDGMMTPLGRPFPSGDEPPLHPHCRCEVVTAYVSPEAARRLAGAQIDYQAAKREIADDVESAEIRQTGQGPVIPFLRGLDKRTSPEQLARTITSRGWERGRDWRP